MFKQLVRYALSAFGLSIVRVNNKSNNSIGKVGYLRHQSKKKGDALLSYIIEPFLLHDKSKISNAHHHDWLSWQIGRIFSSYGYDVDVIDYRDGKFIPQKTYDFFIGARTNFQRLAELLPKQCVKIVHLDTAHWIYNNTASYQRHLELKNRRKVSLNSTKWVEPNWAIEFADYATTNRGNQFNVDTYEYAGKPIFQIPLPTCAVYPNPDKKDFSVCNTHFLWLGSDGLVHKGLDIVLEAFAQLPEYRLTVCGPLRSADAHTYNGPLLRDSKFEAAFHKELYMTENIDTVGWVDIESDVFHRITAQCIGVIFPSCSEGGGASVITCMQAGLIPIVSYQTNVSVGDFGFVLPENSIEQIKKTVRMVSELPIDDLKIRAHDTWRFCRANHTREKFKENYRQVIDKIISGKQE